MILEIIIFYETKKNIAVSIKILMILIKNQSCKIKFDYI